MRFNLPQIILGLAIVLLAATPVLADLEDDLLRYQAEQRRLQGLIDQTRAKENTLANQIAILNNEISLTQVSINTTQAELDLKEAELGSLGNDIGDLSTRIGNLEGDLKGLSVVAAKRFRVSQAIEDAAPFGVTLFSGSFEQYTTDLTYAEYMEHRDQVLFGEMQVVKDNLNVQKTALQNKQAEVQKVRDEIAAKRDELAAAKRQLDGQKADKAYLLRVTQNSEASYQRLLAQTKSEISSIQIALMGGGIRLGHVNVGDTIAHQGNTGCSTGTHVHFGAYQNGVAYNPKPKLDSGYFRWPVLNPRVTQWYGANYSWYMAVFGMPGHNGIDMQTGGWPNGGYGSPIHASKGGTAYLSVESSPCYLTGTRGRGIVIDSGLGQKTIYWHIQ